MLRTKIHCSRCAHYHVTWDPNFPQGCRAMAFKSRERPCAVVLQSSGMECLRFEPKKGGARVRERGGG